MKGMIASIYRSQMDCTNDGISAMKFTRTDVTVLGLPEGEIFEPTNNRPAVVLQNRNGHIAAYPATDDGAILPGWWMFGGNFIYTSDSRFPHTAVPLHDRQETIEQARVLST